MIAKYQRTTLITLILIFLILCVGCTKKQETVKNEAFENQFSDYPINKSFTLEIAPTELNPSGRNEFIAGDKISVNVRLQSGYLLNKSTAQAYFYQFIRDPAEWDLVNEKKQQKLMNIIVVDTFVNNQYYFDFVPPIAFDTQKEFFRLVLLGSVSSDSGNEHEEIAYIDIKMNPFENIREKLIGTWKRSGLQCEEGPDVLCGQLTFFADSQCAIHNINIGGEENIILNSQSCNWSMSDTEGVLPNEAILITIEAVEENTSISWETQLQYFPKSGLSGAIDVFIDGDILVFWKDDKY